MHVRPAQACGLVSVAIVASVGLLGCSSSKKSYELGDHAPGGTTATTAASTPSRQRHRRSPATSRPWPS